MAQRLMLIAAGATTGTREVVFGDRSDLLHPELVEPLVERVASWSCGPEPACVQTAARLQGEAQVVPELADVDLGRWAGRSLAAVAAGDHRAVARWLSDATANPHGGESLAQLVQRVGTYCDARDWSPGRNVLVVAPLVGRAMAVHALAVGPEAIFRIDLAPLGRVGLSRSGLSWRLQQLG